LLDNFYLLKEVSSYLQKEIRGFLIKEIFTQEKDKVVLHLSNNSADKYLEFCCTDRQPYIFLKDNYKKAKRNVLSLMPGLYEQEITDTGIYSDDRIIKFTLTGGIDLFFIFFRMKSNLLVVTDEKIIDAFQNKKDYIGIALADFTARKDEISSGKKSNIKEYFRAGYRQYGDIILKEYLYINRKDGNDSISDEEKSKIDSFVKDYTLKTENPDFLLYQREKNHYLSLVRLLHLNEYEEKQFENVNELILAYLKVHFKKHSGEDLKKKAILQKENQLRIAEKKLMSLSKQIEVAGNAGQLRIFGDLILANIHLLKKGDEKLLLSGEEYPEEIEVKLKRELSPTENASMYYEKYKRQKNSVELIKEKAEVQRIKTEILKKEIEDLKNSKDIKSFGMEEKEIKKDDETSRFRKFKIGEKFEVWVGKDSASNDLLTMRYSAQNDLWFHVRGASGSHTVLKVSDKKNPPDKKAIEIAASIAAYYSKARNASNVPVAYCERKYVKKKKGFKEGSVVMEREKVIFVKPGIPENSN